MISFSFEIDLAFGVMNWLADVYSDLPWKIVNFSSKFQPTYGVFETLTVQAVLKIKNKKCGGQLETTNTYLYYI